MLINLVNQVWHKIDLIIIDHDLNFKQKYEKWDSCLNPCLVTIKV